MTACLTSWLRLTWQAVVAWVTATQYKYQPVERKPTHPMPRLPAREHSSVALTVDIANWSNLYASSRSRAFLLRTIDF